MRSLLLYRLALFCVSSNIKQLPSEAAQSRLDNSFHFVQMTAQEVNLEDRERRM